MILLGLSVPTCLYIAYRGTMYITSASSSSTVLWEFDTIQPFIFIYDGTDEFKIFKTRHCPVRPSMPELTRYHNHFRLSCRISHEMQYVRRSPHRCDIRIRVCKFPRIGDVDISPGQRSARCSLSIQLHSPTSRCRLPCHGRI